MVESDTVIETIEKHRKQKGKYKTVPLNWQNMRSLHLKRTARLQVLTVSNPYSEISQTLTAGKSLLTAFSAWGR